MQYFKGTDAELAEHLRQGAVDLIPYSLDEVESPNLNVALPAFLNEAADRLAVRPSPMEDEAAFEAWRAVPGCDGYHVSDAGRVRGRRGRVLKPNPGKKGYLRFRVGDDKDVSLHAAVLLAFTGPRPAGHHGSHVNGDHIDNRWQNLVWMTPAENEAMKAEHGTKLMGSKCSSARLTEDDVRAIRASPLGNLDISREYGVGRRTIYEIRKGRSWTHVA